MYIAAPSRSLAVKSPADRLLGQAQLAVPQGANGEHEISVEVETGTVHGHFPPRARKLVLEWMGLHTQELLENWQLAKQGQPLKRIAPLE
ncbi:MAG: DUF4160 domain-containing protein [Acidobacteria bacterium]|nr:DUF4160 domain-containing protein [Acidobacteriota bacterium]